ncbi:hypothetical protein MASR2M70_11910 [Bacillota bacterium]
MGEEPYAFIKQPYGSYYGFLTAIGESVDCIKTASGESRNCKLIDSQEKLLSFYSKEILNGKRVEEGVLLALLLGKGSVEIEEASDLVSDNFSYVPSDATWESAIRNLNGQFISEQAKNAYGVSENIYRDGNKAIIDEAYRSLLLKEELFFYIDDMIRYSFARFKADYTKERFRNGFILNNKYGRKDVCRILNWESNEESTMYGYRIKYGTCPIFVTYKKEEDITESTKYEDELLSVHQFSWMTRNRVTLESQEVKQIQNPSTRKLLFVKKSDGEGSDFYYLGDLKPLEYYQTEILNDKGANLPIVNIIFQMSDSVDEALYSYLTAVSKNAP